MQCPECQTENPDTQKFCGECGAKLEKFCSGCGAKNPPQYKFCGECGHNLSLPSKPTPKDLSFDEKLDKIQRYLPKGLTEKILSQRDKIEGERKQVTVMFCDMEGYSQLSEKLGPEEAYDIMDQVYEILIHKVHDYGGTVNEMTGDGIMALFGSPIALEDAPQRAIRSALAIHREMAKFSDGLKQERGGMPSLKMRIGIHTGPVVVGTLGNDLRVEFKAVGDTVNLASRMEGLAKPGTTCAAEETHRVTEGLFRFEALGERTVKGKKAPVKVYKVIAPSTSRTRFDVSTERGLTPFVGRERELELLLDGFERTKRGRGQAFSIVSEAGIGKSRLLYEFRKAISNEDMMFLEGRCLSYSTAVTYHPVIDIIRANFDIREGDRDSEIREKVVKGLKILRVDEAMTLPYFLELLSVKDSGIEKIPMSPDAKKDRIIQAYKLITLKGSEIRPLILAFEDLHWIDKSSEEVLKYVFESIPGARVLMVFTYRPEFVHTWGGKSYHSQVNLNRLSNRESLAMVSHLFGTEDIDSGLEELVLEKTEGVPFFVEEFIKSLKDLKIIERRENKYHLAKGTQQVIIPSTIQDVIMARVDSLPAGAKEVLQTGSVIEREFSYALIKRVTDLTEHELLSHLSVLKDSELLYERGIYPQSTYIFKHTLTREVVYDSILVKKKKKLHEKIGGTIEELYRENISEYYGVLAEHFIKSESYKKAFQYLKLAGKRAEKTGSMNEAILYAKKTISSLERLPRTEEVLKKIIDVRTILGLRMIEMNYFQQAQEAIKPIMELALKSGYKKRVSQIFTIVGSCEFCIEENFPKAFEFLEKALKISEEIGDIASSVAGNYWLGYALSLNCEFERASEHLEKTLNMQVQADNVVWIGVMKSLISNLVFSCQGNINRAYQVSQEAMRIAEESGDIFSKLFAHSGRGIACFCKGLFEEATKHLLEVLDFSEKINHFYMSPAGNQFLGDAYCEIGEYQTATGHYDKAIWFIEENKLMPSWAKLNKIALTRAKVMNKEKDVDLELLYAYVSENKIKWFEGQMQRYVGEILLNIDDQHLSEAGVWMQNAIEADKRNGMIFSLGRDHALYADLLKRKGDQSKAKERLAKAIDILKKCGADEWVKRYEEELASFA
jgi:class 3 adenylate cyclase/tetratricopeptide (TPR) repeat protein